MVSWSGRCSFLLTSSIWFEPQVYNNQYYESDTYVKEDSRTRATCAFDAICFMEKTRITCGDGFCLLVGHSKLLISCLCLTIYFLTSFLLYMTVNVTAKQNWNNGMVKSDTPRTKIHRYNFKHSYTAYNFL